MASNDITITSMSSSGDDLILQVAETLTSSSPPPTTTTTATMTSTPNKGAIGESGDAPSASPIKSVGSSPLLTLNFSDQDSTRDISWATGAEGDISDMDISEIRDTPESQRQYLSRRLSFLSAHREEINKLMTEFAIQLIDVEKKN